MFLIGCGENDTFCVTLSCLFKCVDQFVMDSGRNFHNIPKDVTLCMFTRCLWVEFSNSLLSQRSADTLFRFRHKNHFVKFTVWLIIPDLVATITDGDKLTFREK